MRKIHVATAAILVSIFSVIITANLGNAKVTCVDKHNYASVIPCSDENAIDRDSALVSYFRCVRVNTSCAGEPNNVTSYVRCVLSSNSSCAATPPVPTNLGGGGGGVFLGQPLNIPGNGGSTNPSGGGGGVFRPPNVPVTQNQSINVTLRNVGPAYSCGGITLKDYSPIYPNGLSVSSFCEQQFQKAYNLLLERDAAPGTHLRVNPFLTATKPWDTVLNGTFTTMNPRTGENITVPIEKTRTASFSSNYEFPDPITTIQKSPCTWDGVALGDDTINANIHLEAIDDHDEWAFDADSMSLYQTLQQKDPLLPDLYWCGKMP